VLVVVGCLGCAGGSPKPRSALRGTPEPIAAEAERRPYAELAQAAPVTEDDSPGLWLQIAALARLSDKLPEALQPQLEPFKDVGALLGRVLGADVISVVDLEQPLDVTMEPTASRSREQVAAFRVRSPDALEQGRAGLTRSTARIKVDLLGKVPRGAASPMLVSFGIAERGTAGFSLLARAELDAPALTELLMWRSPPGSTL
jgi:hypothetical protein